MLVAFAIPIRTLMALDGTIVGHLVTILPSHMFQMITIVLRFTIQLIIINLSLITLSSTLLTHPTPTLCL